MGEGEAADRLDLAVDQRPVAGSWQQRTSNGPSDSVKGGEFIFLPKQLLASQGLCSLELLFSNALVSSRITVWYQH
jgi:hypothetical protein